MNGLMFSEFHDDSIGLTFKIEKSIISYQTKFQKLDLYQTKTHGKLLTLDDFIMVTERDEFIYHEMITHIPLYTHSNPKNVLVIGGGDGGTVREIVKHDSVENIDMIEIDEDVVKVARQFLPTMSCELENEKVNLHFVDGIKWVEDKVDVYDLIIIDSTDPINIGEGLFSREFYINCNKALKSGGILVNQSESPFYNPEWVENIYSKLNDCFAKVKPYMSYTPTYPAIWTFGMCFKDEDASEKFDISRFKMDALELNYYNEEIHTACFALPTFVKKLTSKK